MSTASRVQVSLTASISFKSAGTQSGPFALLKLKCWKQHACKAALLIHVWACSDTLITNCTELGTVPNVCFVQGQDAIQPCGLFTANSSTTAAALVASGQFAGDGYEGSMCSFSDNEENTLACNQNLTCTPMLVRIVRRRLVVLSWHRLMI